MLLSEDGSHVLVVYFLYQREKSNAHDEPNTEDLEKASQAKSDALMKKHDEDMAESDALMKKLDEDIARVLDLESSEQFYQDHNADKRDAVKPSCMC